MRGRWIMLCSGLRLLAAESAIAEGPPLPDGPLLTANSPATPAAEAHAPSFSLPPPALIQPPETPHPGGPPAMEQSQLFPSAPTPGFEEPSLPALAPVQPEASNPAPAPTSADPESKKLSVSRISYVYGRIGKAINVDLPPLTAVTTGQAMLGQSSGGFTGPKRGHHPVAVSVLGGKKAWYYGDALLELYNQVVQNLNNEYGIYGVYIIADPAQVDPVTLEDKRPAGQNGLTVQVYVSEVRQVRTIFRHSPPLLTEEAMVDLPAWSRIVTHSPVQAGAPGNGGLFKKFKIESYLQRINRFYGRKVSASLSVATGREQEKIAVGDVNEGAVSLDYLIQEQKHLSVYAQTSNTGTDQTGVWRSRLGLEYRQLLKADDTLRLEYGTSDFSGFQSALFSYEFTPVFPDYLKLKAYANWSRYSSADLGNSEVSFAGESFTYGASATWTPIYVQGFPVDLYAGAEWLNARVSNSGLGRGSTDFLLPYVGIGTDKGSDKFTLAANVELQMNLRGLAQTDSGADLDVLGRVGTSNSFVLAKWNFSLSFFVEPLLFGKAWGDETAPWWKSTQAHEIAFSVRGQYAPDHARLPPQLQYVAGGLFTVRGYPESFAAGDTAVVSSLEYRFHLPRALEPRDKLEAAKKKAAGSAGATPAAEATAPAAHPFSLRPETLAGGQNWDLIMRTFVDFGTTLNNNALSYEPDRTMLGAGAGVELQIFRPVFASARLDYGVALFSAEESQHVEIRPGSSRVHLSFSLAW